MVLEERVPFRESELVGKADLYERWPHATMDEIVELCDNKSLRAYSHIKGPIKGILYCIAVDGVQHRSSFPHNESYYDDEHVSYFLLEDVKRCERKYPDFLGSPAIDNTALDEDPFADFTPPGPQEEIPEAKIPNRKVTQLLRVISATEVAKRWGLGAANLQEMVNKSRRSQFHHLPVYTSPQKRTRPLDGQMVYFCNGPYYGFPEEWGEYDLEGHYFNANDVEGYEAAHPEEVWPVVTGDQTEEESEFLAADDVRKELGMSPSQFVEMLCGKKGPRLITSREKTYLAVHSLHELAAQYDPSKVWEPAFFTTDGLKKLSIRRKDLQKYLHEQQATTEPALDVLALKAQLAEALVERGKLLETLEKANARIVELETAAIDPQPLTRTQAATQARQEKALDGWLPKVDAMIKVAIQCGKEGPKLRQQPDLNVMFNEFDAELTERQRKFFRKCLPDEHFDRNGDNQKD